jgi:hypothetical protein
MRTAAANSAIIPVHDSGRVKRWVSPAMILPPKTNNVRPAYPRKRTPGYTFPRIGPNTFRSPRP